MFVCVVFLIKLSPFQEIRHILTRILWKFSLSQMKIFLYTEISFWYIANVNFHIIRGCMADFRQIDVWYGKRFNLCLFSKLLKFQFTNQSQFDGTHQGNNADFATSSSQYERVLISINIVFTILFTVECILKILAFGVKVCRKNLC